VKPGWHREEKIVVNQYRVRAQQSLEFYTEERCYITELCNSGYNAGASLAIARVEGGITTQLHALTGTTETYIVIDGVGQMEVDGHTFAISAGDQVVIPPGVSQRVGNEGEADLRFYCLCTPRFQPECYVNLEAQA
jgi:mannose-6-phosphate isomerase-like protein (cupin superfamily)